MTGRPVEGGSARSDRPHQGRVALITGGPGERYAKPDVEATPGDLPAVGDQWRGSVAKQQGRPRDQHGGAAEQCRRDPRRHEPAARRQGAGRHGLEVRRRSRAASPRTWNVMSVGIEPRGPAGLFGVGATVGCFCSAPQLLHDLVGSGLFRVKRRRGNSRGCDRSPRRRFA
jgi:hypothetical protein